MTMNIDKGDKKRTHRNSVDFRVIRLVVVPVKGLPTNQDGGAD